jgi:2-methylisocitrate lyase-like PEP mutase family enzyme
LLILIVKVNIQNYMPYLYKNMECSVENNQNFQSLKERLDSKEIIVAPGIYDALSGLFVQQAGFETVYLSGASLAYTRYGRPDIGLIGMREVADAVTAIRERIDVDLIVDGDTGYGNALNVIRTIKEFERAGASAIQLEDQSLPKRCGHLTGKSLVSSGEMVGKLKAAVDTRRSEETLIIARTDAIAVEGFQSALDRAEEYREAGADVLFIEAPENRDQMIKMNSQFKDRAPLLANMVEGGKTPVSGADDLASLGLFDSNIPRWDCPGYFFCDARIHGKFKRDRFNCQLEEQNV